MSDTPPVELLVCTTCRCGQPKDAEAPRPGTQLYKALSEQPLPEGVTLRPVECLSNCSQGCTIGLRGPDRWTYVYGGLEPETHVDVILDGLKRYLNAPNGIIPWRERPEHFKRNCVVRIPPMEAAHA
jgi:predicted metal-binding protein